MSMMIVPDEDDDNLQYFDDDLSSFSSQETVLEMMGSSEELSEGEAEAAREGLFGGLHHHTDSTVSMEGFNGFRSIPNPNPVVGNNDDVTAAAVPIRHSGGGDCDQLIPEVVQAESVKVEEEEEEASLQAAEREPEEDVFGRRTSKGRSNWFISEYGSIFRLMDGDLLPKELTKPARKATSDIKYIKQLYTGDVSLSELSVGEDAKRIGWGTFFKGDPEAWNLWNSEMELDSLTTLDVQRNVAAAVNSRRKMQWAIGVERNGMVTGVSFNEETKDILRQAIDFALSREFVPELDPRIVKVDFVRVSAVTGDRYLVLITINSAVDTLHQLSSGRIFYLVGDKVVMAESINQIRLALVERMKHDGRASKKGLSEGGASWMPRWTTVVAAGLGLSIGLAAKRWIK